MGILSGTDFFLFETWDARKLFRRLNALGILHELLLLAV